MDVQRAYVGATRLDDPVLPPMKGDLAGVLPTLFLTSTRDWFFGGTSLFHRAMMHAGNEPELVVFEAFNHGFWENPTLPKSDEADRIAVSFFSKHLKARWPWTPNLSFRHQVLRSLRGNLIGGQLSMRSSSIDC